MEYAIVGLVILVFAVFVVKSYMKKLASGCCGSGDAPTRKIKVQDKNKAHYPYHAILTVDGMMCSACQTRVENAINALPGAWARADVATGRVELLMKEQIPEQQLRDAVNELGVYTLMRIEQ